jgi:hypothetical protein
MGKRPPALASALLTMFCFTIALVNTGPPICSSKGILLFQFISLFRNLFNGCLGVTELVIRFSLLFQHWMFTTLFNFFYRTPLSQAMPAALPIPVTPICEYNHQLHVLGIDTLMSTTESYHHAAASWSNLANSFPASSTSFFAFIRM